MPVAVLASAATLLLHLPASGQMVPVLTGSVNIDLGRGGLAADVCLNNITSEDNAISFALNRAYTIKRITGVEEQPAVVELEPGGAALRYTFIRSDAGAASRTFDGGPICLEYSGSHPIYEVEDGDYRADDASSVVAFNGRVIRARGAARWYPVPYNQQTQLTSDAVAFRIRVNCDECERIYVNGSEPVEGTIGDFVSREPREILLIAGDLPQTRVNGTLILGETVNPDSAVAFVAAMEEIEKFYAEYTGLPFGLRPDVIRLEALREPRRGQLWGFFSDPALVLIGMAIPEFVEILGGPARPARRAVLGFLAHELAHRYFGWTIGNDSPQRDLFGEPFATYLELKAVRAILGEADYLDGLESLYERAVAGPELRPLDEAGPDDLAIPSYRYGFAPLQLFALEQTIGEARMRSLLAALLTAPAHERATADYKHLRLTALRVGVTEDEWEGWENRCVRKRLSASDCFRSGQP